MMAEFCGPDSTIQPPVAPEPIDKKSATPEQLAEHKQKSDKYNAEMVPWEAKATKIIEANLRAELKKKQQSRMPFVIVPDEPKALGISDKEGNTVHRIFVYKNQAEDVIKALRRKQYTPKIFSYNKTQWEKDDQDRKQLNIEVDNATKLLKKSGLQAFEVVFATLMHMKVVRAYIDGVLRFGIPPKFYIGLLVPKPKADRLILQEMSDVLADPSLKDMYGEKADANDAEDYWPFVCVHLTSPNFDHVQKE